MNTNFSRRRFLESSAAVLGVSLLGCQAKPADGPQSQANADGSITLTGVEGVGQGTALAFTFPSGEPGLFFVTKSGESGAVSAKCTHLGCLVQWTDDVSVPLRCPCHESHFALDGKVLSGPAKTPLTHYSVAKTGNSAVLRSV